GSTRLTRRFVRSDPVADDELVAMRVHALRLLGPMAERVRASSWDVVAATSKTFRTLGAVAAELPEVPLARHDFGFAGIDGRTAPRPPGGEGRARSAPAATPGTRPTARPSAPSPSASSTRPGACTASARPSASCWSSLP